MTVELHEIPFWANRFPNRRVIILDGGLATELERRGADLKDDLWSAKLLLENPDLIRQVHCDYLAAGADVITSASYQASLEGFAQRGLDLQRAADLLRLSVQLALDARAEFGRPILVAASVGPFGAFLHDGSEFRGDYGLSLEELMNWHRPRLQVLADSGADLLACETIPCQVEAEAIVRLLEEVTLPVWISFSCRDDLHLCHGERFREAVRAVQESDKVIAVGVNCSAPRYVEGLLKSVGPVATKPLVVYPNSGEVWNQGERAWMPGTESGWAALVPRWIDAGARLVGGCCRTTPAMIRVLRSRKR